MQVFACADAQPSVYAFSPVAYPDIGTLVPRLLKRYCGTADRVIIYGCACERNYKDMSAIYVPPFKGSLITRQFTDGSVPWVPSGQKIFCFVTTGISLGVPSTLEVSLNSVLWNGGANPAPGEQFGFLTYPSGTIFNVIFFIPNPASISEPAGNSLALYELSPAVNLIGALGYSNDDALFVPLWGVENAVDLTVPCINIDFTSANFNATKWVYLLGNEGSNGSKFVESQTPSSSVSINGVTVTPASPQQVAFFGSSFALNVTSKSVNDYLVICDYAPNPAAPPATVPYHDPIVSLPFKFRGR